MAQLLCPLVLVPLRGFLLPAAGRFFTWGLEADLPLVRVPDLVDFPDFPDLPLVRVPLRVAIFDKWLLWQILRALTP